MGLPRNRAAFIITPIEKEKDQFEIFKIDSTIPQKWVGELSVIADESINNKYDPRKHHLSL